MIEMMEDLRTGKSAVIEENHTLLLGWTSSTVSLISEIVIANESEGGGVIVILADEDKQEMEEVVRERVENLLGSQVVCRSGFPIRVEDLRRVSAGTAKSIIVLADESCRSADESDAKSLRIMLSLSGLL